MVDCVLSDPGAEVPSPIAQDLMYAYGRRGGMQYIASEDMEQRVKGCASSTCTTCTAFVTSRPRLPIWYIFYGGFYLPLGIQGLGRDRHAAAVQSDIAIPLHLSSEYLEEDYVGRSL